MGFWFQDSIEFVPGCTLNVKISDFLCRTRSKFQDIWVVETQGLGRMLVIDGVTMLTEFDEFAYHEMISHVPLLVHPKPSRVLVIGGGDGGVVREVLKHPEVESVHLCEIDEEVVNVCREYLPSQAGSLDDPRVKIFYEDGAKFAANHPGSYEVIIVDSNRSFRARADSVSEALLPEHEEGSYLPRNRRDPVRVDLPPSSGHRRGLLLCKEALPGHRILLHCRPDLSKRTHRFQLLFSGLGTRSKTLMKQGRKDSRVCDTTRLRFIVELLPCHTLPQSSLKRRA